ncbi:hypothetical protein [Photobacterium phosphoreum]|uniref:hypothetical protein n=1 Tax=Photobacterium phosphoreum TaxID=659 RepID=UPI000D1753D0|nr:hypothetical protein [Photobacterium phosphoreum]PSU75291.1 hypothetical protein CTM67_16425 [Photobacterium phosphoreum]
MKKSLIILSALSGLTLSTSVFADIDVTISPNDTYIARMNLNVNKNTFTLPGNAFYLCGALKPSCLSGVDIPYGEVNNNGITYKIISGKLNYHLENYSYSSSYTQGANCSNFPPPPYSSTAYMPECSDISNGLSIGFITGLLSGKLASGNVSISAVEISAKGAKPGKQSQRVYLNQSLSQGQWSVLASETLNVIVKDTTCSIQNQTVDMGTIFPGNTVKKKLNLNLTCNNPIGGASWKYTNVNYNGVNNTNLNNVSISVKNNKNEIINSDTFYTNTNELNDLSVEVDAKSNAEGGKLNVPLRFTLTYS